MITLPELQNLITSPYPPKTELSRGCSPFATCDNFFRNTPVRKIMLVYDNSGDYEYDAEMTSEKEIEISIENEKNYKETQSLLFEFLKQYPFQEGKYPSNLDFSHNYDDEAKEDTTLPGEEFEWTPEYEGGIHTFDNETNTIWDLGTEYLYLGCGSNHGDVILPIIRLFVSPQKQMLKVILHSKNYLQ